MKQKIDLKPLIQQADLWIRQGQIAAAKRLVLSTATRGLANEQRLALAILGRRTGALDHGLKLLHPVVRGRGRAIAKPSATEATEYAALLVYKGATEEALALLAQVDVDAEPQADLFRAFAYFSRWEYRQSLAPLRRFVRSARLSDYQRLVGELNLLAALAGFTQEDFEKRWPEFRKACEQSGHFLLLQSGWEVAAQHAHFHRDEQEASRRLTEAERLLAQPDTVPALYIKKWRWILRFSQANREQLLRECTLLRAEAQRLQNWETLREIDYFWATFTQDHKLLDKVWWGTPYRAYRERMREQNKDWLPSESFSLHESQKNIELASIFSAESLPQLLLHALVDDFYRPANLMKLWQNCQGKNFYHPLVSARSLHQLLWRVREELRRKALPMAIRESRETYSLEINKNYSLKLQAPLNRYELNQRCLQGFVTAFSAKQASRALGCSLRSANTILAELMAQGFVLGEGATRSRSYRLVVEAK